MNSSDEEDIALSRLAKKSSSITSASTYEDDEDDDIPWLKIQEEES